MKAKHLKLGLVAAALLLAPEVAMANGFDGLGDRLVGVLCQFIGSKLVTFIAGAAVLALLVAISLNEDNRALGTFLKIGLGIAGVIFLPSILGMLGLVDMNC